MVKINKVGMAAVLVGLMASAGTVQAQEYNGTTGAAPTSSTSVVSTSTATTGDSTVAPFQNTTTTTQRQSVDSTTAATTTGVTKTVNGVVYGGTVTVSGTGSQLQDVATSITTTYNPGPPPTVVSTSAPSSVTTPVGTASVTAVSANGVVGAGGGVYGSTLASSGTPTNGAVVATEEAFTLTSSGVVFEKRVGTATYNPTTGNVTVALPTAATSSTSLTSSGISTTGAISSGSLTTGAISATGLNMNGNKITNVAAGTANTDAVNVGQLNSAVATLTGNFNTFTASVNANLLRYRKLAQAGTAVAVAMSGGTFLPDKKVNLTVNFGHFEGESAMSGQLGFLVSPNVALNAGVATSFTKGGGTAFRVGGTFGF